MNQLFRNRMKSLLAVMSVLPCAGALAQASADMQPAQTSVAAQAPGADRLTPSELEELVGPIALYPDPLLANVLAASVYPDEVAEAAKFIGGGGKADQVDAKPWEDPVKAVAKIPDAIKMMGQYKDWTIAMGQAYLIQAKDVMDVIQTLRKKAQQTGALQTSPQQQVVVEQQVVYIKPADPEIIYVPTYSPSVVYVQQPASNAAAASVVGFGVGVATGLILANNLDCDYHGGCVGYGYHGGGNDVNVNVNRNTNINNTNINNISGNNVGNTANVGNRVGNEGNAYAPNKSKSLATAQSNQLNQFKGGATAANRAEVPGGRGVAANNANAADRSAQAAGRSDANTARQANPNAASRTPQTPPKQSSESAFSGGKGTQAESQRGASSRSGSSGGSGRSSPSGGSGRSGGSGGGGGGGRSGGGGGGGRGR